MQIATLLLLTCGLVTSKNANRRATNDAKEAALKGNVESLQQAIDRGADLDDRKGRGTPLLHAVLRASPDVVGMLLAAGANPELGNLEEHEVVVVLLVVGCTRVRWVQLGIV